MAHPATVATILFSFLAILVSPCSAADSTGPEARVHRKPVLSTALAAAGYSQRHHVLEIEFCNGAIYRYLAVPSSVYRKLLSANSKARYYDSNIKGKYRSLRLRAAQSRMVSFGNEPDTGTTVSHPGGTSE